LVKRKVSGFDGCNGLGGNITVMGKRIRFDALMSTLKACIQNSSYNFKLGLISNNLVDYHFENDNLVLYLIDDSRLQFTPVYK
jgi:heat shock protein HslJ